MRKSLMLILVLLLTACCVYAAADTVFTLENCAGNIAIDEGKFIVLTAGNLDDHPDLLATLGKTKEEQLADWQARGVQLQAWNEKMDVCLEVIVKQDDDSRQYYDLEQQSKGTRAEYLKHLKSSGQYAEMGYTMLIPGRVIDQPQWKKQTNGGNFIKFEYKRTVDGKTWRGFIRHTIRNGYTIVMDYQVFNRLPLKNDETIMNRIANTITFAKVDPAPDGQETTVEPDGQGTQPAVAEASGLLTVTVPPPTETLDGVFTVEGKTTPGARLIGVAMRYVDNAEPKQFYADATNAGNFKVKFELPEEGMWMLTLDLELNGQVVTRTVFDALTFSRTQLPLQLDQAVPDQQTSDQLILSGVTTKAVQVQCIVTLNGETTPIFHEQVTTNGTGKFKFKIPTVLEGTYVIRLDLQKKNFTPRSKDYKTVRIITEQDTYDRTAATAIHPAYKTLVSKTESYIGKTLVYEVHILKTEQVGEEWIITTALKKNKGEYSNYLVFLAKSDPMLESGNKIRMYGVCSGTYEFQSEEGVETCPQLQYLFNE